MHVILCGSVWQAAMNQVAFDLRVESFLSHKISASGGLLKLSPLIATNPPFLLVFGTSTCTSVLLQCAKELSIDQMCGFQTWASQKIRSLSKGRIDDPSILLDVLMDTPSNGEVVEGCLVNIERNGDVSAFATEFIRYLHP